MLHISLTFFTSGMTPVWFTRKTATYVITLTNILVDKIICVARLMQIQCHCYMNYSNCNMNE